MFSLVRVHGLYGVMRDQLAQLIELDQEQAVRLLVACADHLPPATVVQRLRQHQPQALYQVGPCCARPVGGHGPRGTLAS